MDFAGCEISIYRVLVIFRVIGVMGNIKEIEDKILFMKLIIYLFKISVIEVEVEFI